MVSVVDECSIEMVASGVILGDARRDNDNNENKGGSRSRWLQLIVW